MNGNSDELAKALAPPATRRGALKNFGVSLAKVALTAVFALSSQATDFKRGQTVQLSTTSPWPGCDPGGFGPGPFPDDVEVEPHAAVNPANPKNIVAVWPAGRFRGLVASVSFDGGRRWQQVPIPGLTVCSGGTDEAAVDEWLTFAPNGDLYLVTDVFNRTHVEAALLVIKSGDGGLHWSAPTTLYRSTASHTDLVQPRVTADPFDSRFVYVSVTFDQNGNKASLWFFRTTDGGANWTPAAETYAPNTSNNQMDGSRIVVLPDGALICFFTEVLYYPDNGSSPKEALMTLVRSTDRGSTWSSPIRIGRQPSFDVLDPNTGHGVINLGSAFNFPAFNVASDPSNGHLYVVYEDPLLSGNQASSIAFIMSADRGLTWSAPVAVNQTPASVPPGNRQAFHPAVAVAADGTIGVTYYDFRFNDSVPGLATDFWLVHCHPSVTTPATEVSSWRSETRLTDTSFNFETAPDVGAYFLADYYGLSAAGNDFLEVFPQTHGTDPGSIFFRRAGP